MKFQDLVLIGGIFCSLIATILLLAKCRSHSHANRLLAVVIFAWGWYTFIYLLMVTGWLISIPHLYRIGSPLYYLIPPCGFLYVRSLLNDETKFRKYDWLHFLPAILNLIDLIPFYIVDTDTKRQVVEAVYQNFNMSYQNASGILPTFWHFQLRWIQGIIYLVIQCIMIRSMLVGNKGEDFKNFRTVINWVVIFSSFNAFIYVGLGIMSVIAWINLGTNVNLITSGRSIPAYFQIIGFMGLSVYLFFTPEILYGIPRYLPENQSAPPALNPPSKKEEIKEAPFSIERTAEYASRLDKYMEKHQPFKVKGLTINDLSKRLNIPVHHLSYLLNNHYHKRFTDFINEYRVAFIKNRFQSKEWKDYTFEGLAIEAGFLSRSNFFTAFKKSTGFSPSEYLKKIQHQS